jgi:uroporphyrinogen-III decarboxylase
MDRSFYLSLAARGLRMPIAADLVLGEHQDHEAVRLDGARLGRVLEETARRYGTPLAFPLMDLRLEKADLLAAYGIEDEAHQFAEPPPAVVLEGPFPARNRAHIESVAYIASETELVPVGMAIGPFSLMTKLVADPITPLALAGMGLEDPGLALMERCLEMAERAVARSCEAQVRAGARAMLICEPAANVVYISPKQMEAGADTFERFVMGPDLRLRDRLAAAGVDLVFHDCGQLCDPMVEAFARRLHPAILSLGSSRRLWEDARLVPDDVVLFGNLPTKSFYSDAEMPVARVRELAAELVERMRATGHPFVLGSECDVLHVPEAAATIRRKVEAVFAAAVLG